MIRKVYAVICVLIFYSGISPAQAKSPQEMLSLHEALTMAYQQNPRVVQARKAI